MAELIKTNHKNTKEGKHEINFLPQSQRERREILILALSARRACVYFFSPLSAKRNKMKLSACSASRKSGANGRLYNTL